MPRDIQEALFETATKGQDADRQELARLLHDVIPGRCIRRSRPKTRRNCVHQATLSCKPPVISPLVEDQDARRNDHDDRTNIRCGVVETCSKKSRALSKASVWKSELWRHADDEPSREEAVKRLVKMLKDI